MDLLIGMPLGILASLVAWWIIFHGLMPVLEFSPSIGKITDESSPNGFKYRVKIVNSGRRDILDVEFFARISIKGIRTRYPDNISNFDLRLSSSRTPVIERKKNKLIRIYPEHLKLPAEVGAPELKTLEDIMEFRGQASITIFCFGFDAFTGTRHLFKSKAYKRGNIEFGFFFLKNCLEVDKGNSVAPRVKGQALASSDEK